jgi:hypothetical protein
MSVDRVAGVFGDIRVEIVVNDIVGDNKVAVAAGFSCMRRIRKC